jgi:hypothetical protein
MRLRLIFGALLILLGGVILARGLHYNSTHDVVDMGSMRVSLSESKPIAPWIGGVVALAGLLLVFSGGAARRR